MPTEYPHPTRTSYPKSRRSRVSPDVRFETPEEFPRLLDGEGEYMRRPYNLSQDVQKLAMPVMLVCGDSDMIRPEHIVEFYQLLDGGLRDAGWMRERMSRNRLAILPDVTHYEMFLTRDGQDGPAVPRREERREELSRASQRVAMKPAR